MSGRACSTSEWMITKKRRGGKGRRRGKKGEGRGERGEGTRQTILGAEEA